VRGGACGRGGARVGTDGGGGRERGDRRTWRQVARRRG